MDLSKAIAELMRRRKELDRVIASLEELESGGAGQPALSRSRRGRKSMGAEERLEVSVRMKAYWAKRRRASR